MKAVFTSEPSQLCNIRDFVRDALSGLTMAETERDLVVLAVDEACTNVIRHAYGGKPGNPIDISAECSASKVRFLIRDCGAAVDAGCIQSRKLEDIRPGGLGVFFMQQAFDEVCYHPCQPGTELELIKHMRPPDMQ